MKKFFYFLLVNALIVTTAFTNLSAQEAAEDSAHPSFQLLLSGGLGYASNKSMNDMAESVGKKQAYQYNALLASGGHLQGFAEKKSNNANANLGLELELRFFSSVNFGLGLGTGIHVAEGSYDVTSPHYSDKIECSAFMATVPFAGTLYYIAPLSENSFFVIGGGVAYYFAFMDIEATNNNPTPSTIYEPLFLGDTTALGYHIRADYNYLIGSLSLTGGVRARYVKFKEFDDAGNKLKFDAGLTGIDIYFGAGLAI